MKRNSYFIFLSLVFLITGCFAKNELKTDTAKKKEEVQDFSHLEFQTELTGEDKKYYEAINKKISEIGKSFAYMELDAAEKYCPILTKMFDEISQRPISIYRERERERERGLLVRACGFPQDYFWNKYPPLNYKEYLYLHGKIQGSSQILKHLATTELHFSLEDSNGKEASKYRLLFDEHYDKSFKEDPLDLEPYINDFSSLTSKRKKEYCQKAVELEQWDHIYYLTKNIPPLLVWDIEWLIVCLKKEQDCERCSEAVKLVAGHWPKNYLLSAELTNPHADLLPDSYYEEHEGKLKKLIKELYGRDLDKE